MNRDALKETVMALALLAIPVLPVSLWEMPAGSWTDKGLAALVLLLAAWALSVGVIEVLDRRVRTGIIALVAGLLLLAGCDAVGVFDAVGL